MANTQDIFVPIDAGDLDGVHRLLDADAGLVHVRRLTVGEDGSVAKGFACESALGAAARAGQLDIVKLLIDHGAEVYDVAQWGYPAVFHAHPSQPDIVKFFLSINGQVKHRPTDAPTYGFGIDINLAARFGWLEIVKKHIRHDRLAVHQRGVIGETPLHWAAHNGYVDVVRTLLDSGADIEADEVGLYGGKPLHWAAEHEPEVVRLLLQRGAQVDSRNLGNANKSGFTPLIMCAIQPNACAECAELLLNAGADINATDAEGRTAIAWAMKRGSRRVEKVLRARGAVST